MPGCKNPVTKRQNAPEARIADEKIKAGTAEPRKKPSKWHTRCPSCYRAGETGKSLEHDPGPVAPPPQPPSPNLPFQNLRGYLHKNQKQ